MSSLFRKYPLPDGWSKVEAVGDSIVADGFELQRSGMACVAPSGEEITGSAASRDESPEARGYFELLERASVMWALASGAFAEIFPESPEPSRWRYARSNGVALHADRDEAARRAFWELCERDRVLRSWYGEIRPEPLTRISDWLDSPSYDFRVYRFGPAHAGSLGADGVHVAGVFGFPKQEGLPLVAGYAGRGSLDDARAAAEREALQQLAFLWGETLPADVPPVLPHAMGHLDWQLWPGRRDALERWLAGGHSGFAPRAPRARVSNEVQLLDITPPWLHGLFVVKAVSPAAALLAFGDSPFVAHLPHDLRVHPIA